MVERLRKPLHPLKNRGKFQKEKKKGRGGGNQHPRKEIGVREPEGAGKGKA